jgi:hypothetical protein
MGFIRNSLDLKKLARTLDRKPAQPDRNTLAFAQRDIIGHQLDDLDDYAIENVFIPILLRDALPVADLDIDRISDEDISALYEAFESTDHHMLKFCLTFQAFPAASAKRKIMI